MTFRDLEYEIQSGQIVFDDPRGRPTRLRMVADTEINPYRIRLDLDASTEKVDFQLSSSPALSQTDILAPPVDRPDRDRFVHGEFQRGQ